MNMNYAKFYSKHLSGLKRAGKMLGAWCPFHPDEGSKHKGLVINPENGIWHCFSAHCDYSKGWYSLNKFCEVKGIESPYTGRRYGYPSGTTKVITGKRKAQWEGKEDARSKHPYNLRAINFARKHKKTLWICEGEKDTETMLEAGELAIGIPSATSTAVLEGISFDGIPEVIIAGDHDPAGKAMIEKILKENPFFSYVKWKPGLRKGFDLTDAKEVSEAKSEDFLEKLKGDYVVSKVPKLQTGRRIVKTKYPPIKWAVEKLIPEGLVILAGKPKRGKSLLAMNICIAIACGERVLGREVQQGTAIYLDLEDTERRIQSRIGKMHMVSDHKLQNVKFATDFPRIDNNGIAYLRNEIEKTPNCRLVVIDPWVKFKPYRPGKKFDEYAINYDEMGLVKALSEELNIPILIICHSPKTGSEDPIDLVLDTIGQVGVADAILVLLQKQGRKILTIAGGRDMQEEEYVVELDGTTLTWNLLGKPWQFKSTDERQRLYNALSDEPKSSESLALEAKVSPEYVYNQISKLVADGSAIKVKKGFYKKGK